MAELVLIKNDEVVALLEKRHILDEDIEQVIERAEESGEKLYRPDEERYLAKLRLSEATFYVEYGVSAEGYIIHSAYSHRSNILEDD
jgi:hypothetical protein